MRPQLDAVHCVCESEAYGRWTVASWTACDVQATHMFYANLHHKMPGCERPNSQSPSRLTRKNLLGRRKHAGDMGKPCGDSGEREKRYQNADNSESEIWKHRLVRGRSVARTTKYLERKQFGESNMKTPHVGEREKRG
jgi:hypothetical protein